MTLFLHGGVLFASTLPVLCTTATIAVLSQGVALYHVLSRSTSKKDDGEAAVAMTATAAQARGNVKVSALPSSSVHTPFPFGAQLARQTQPLQQPNMASSQAKRATSMSASTARREAPGDTHATDVPAASKQLEEDFKRALAQTQAMNGEDAV